MTSSSRQSYLASLGIPRGLESTFEGNLSSCDLRLMLIDNSSSMLTRDAHRIGGRWDAIQRIDGATRWEEMQDCVAFCADMASRCWMPTKFCLVNDPGSNSTPQKFSLCCNSQASIPAEMQLIKRVMTQSNPAQHPQNPLACHIRNIASFISAEAPRLYSLNKHVTLIICTQGLPTDQHGTVGPYVIHEFQQALLSLCSLPVKIVFRLFTDDERAIEFYNSIDTKTASIDVLDDYWGEALEVYLHNPWLTYGLGLHRLREAGLAWGIIDIMDERPLSIDELYQFCKCFLLSGQQSEGHFLPHPRVNWNSFLQSLSVLLQKEKMQWNPVLGRLTPWMDLVKLNSICSGGNGSQSYSQSPYVPPPPQPNAFPTPLRNAAGGTTFMNNQQTNQNVPSQPSQTDRLPQNKPKSAPNESASQQPLDEHRNKPLKDQILLSWALQPPLYHKLYPLQRLLVTVPQNFARVETHAYFDKWKQLSEEAFVGNGSEQMILLKRGKFCCEGVRSLLFVIFTS
eukprot:CCRYP_001600-RA/>CCRYP_001600-RA protein AED:0.03 eAED:0.03 QI:100/1/1/1/1/1/2/193/510